MTTTRFTKHTAPTTIVIFGGTGDLTTTKLLPALLDLYIGDALPDAFRVISISRKELTDEAYQAFVHQSVIEKGHHHDPATVASFCRKFTYLAGSFSELKTYEKIKAALVAYDASINQCTNKLLYLAVPPQHYEELFRQIHSSGLMTLCSEAGSWSRLLVEKPFGKDLATAQALERTVCSLFTDEQIYRIDHYLAKDAIENIISMRFANSIIADSWNAKNIASITVRLLETKDVSGRGAFYDDIGTLRDVGQNHMLQILALLTMSAVDIHDPVAVRHSRATALAALSEQIPEVIIRGQYDGYSTTAGVAADSTTETYFKIVFRYSDAAWGGTAVTLEAGKALDQQLTEAVITFNSHDDCRCTYGTMVHSHQNILRIQFAPKQKVSLSMWVKKPGFHFVLEERQFVLATADGEDSYSPEAYERVLYDCIAGDQTRFVSGAEVEAAWRFISPIFAQFATLPLLTYPRGSAGPDTITPPTHNS